MESERFATFIISCSKLSLGLVLMEWSRVILTVTLRTIVSTIWFGTLKLRTGKTNVVAAQTHVHIAIHKRSSQLTTFA